MGKSDTVMFALIGVFGVLGGAAGLVGGIWLLKWSAELWNNHPIGTVVMSTAFGAVLGAGLLGLPIWLLIDRWFFSSKE